jgi:hypothetical protein
MAMAAGMGTLGLTTAPVKGAGASQEVALAGVVVAFGGGTVREACVALPAEGASGIDLLRLAGFDAVAEVTALGAKVCAIDGAGCGYPEEPCWCECRSLGEACTYWIYHQAVDGGWEYSTIGASDRRVQAGEVDGWAWGAGGEGYGAEPPHRTFADVCAGAGDGEPPPGSPTEPGTVAPATTEPPPDEPAPPEATRPVQTRPDPTPPDPTRPDATPPDATEPGMGGGETGSGTGTPPGPMPGAILGPMAPALSGAAGTGAASRVGGLPTLAIPAPSTLSAIGTALAGGPGNEANSDGRGATITPGTIALADTTGAGGTAEDGVSATGAGQTAVRPGYVLGAVVVAVVLAAGAAVGRRGRRAPRRDRDQGRR